MSTVLVVVGVIVGVMALLALSVWLIGRAEAWQEARELDAMRQVVGPSILGDAPRHMRTRRPPILGKAPRHMQHEDAGHPLPRR